MKLKKNAKLLLIFNIFKGQSASAVNQLLQRNDIVVIHVPSNHTNLFQPPDVLVNKSAKYYLSSKHQDWYSETVLEQLNRGANAYDVKVDIHLSTIKPLHAKWIVNMFKFMKESKDLIIYYLYAESG